MGLFGKLFEKKECDICGSEIGLLDNRKLEDGNLCKECAKKLSPWFDDRRHSTVEQIREQLEYREANKEKVAAFCVTRTLGENTRVLLDEDAGLFMVTSTRNLQEANPDVLAFTDVTGCNLDIDEDEQEIMCEGKDGKRESYNPPRFKYYYDFRIIIQVRNPYFDDITFKLNNSRVEIEDRSGAVMLGQVSGRPVNNGYNPENDVDYRRYKEMGEEIREVLLQIRQKTRNQVATAAMLTVQDSLICRIVDGLINMDVEFQYEATYGYHVTDQEYFEERTGGQIPQELLDNTMKLCIMQAFQQVYPEGMILAEVERPNQTKLTQVLTGLVNESWNKYAGISLSSFSLQSFRGDPVGMEQLTKIQEMQRVAGMFKEESKKVVCPYCNSMVLPNDGGRCPACDAMLKEETNQ